MRSLPRVLTLLAALTALTTLTALRVPAEAAEAADGQVTDAHAVPVKSPFAKKAGKLARTSCPETEIAHGGVPRARQYLGVVMKCLDKSWGAYFARAGWTFRKPVVRYYDEPAGTVCGGPWPGEAAVFYCPGHSTIVFPLTGRWIENRTDLYPFKVAAHEYAHHLQKLRGLRPGAERSGEPKRRYELQADCLAGVFLGSVWHSLDRGDQDWEALLDATRASGDEEDGRHSHGAPASRASWLKRGYLAVSPSACDTWSAPAAAVD